MQLATTVLRHPAGRRLHDQDVPPVRSELIEARWAWLVAVVRHLDDEPVAAR